MSFLVCEHFFLSVSSTDNGAHGCAWFRGHRACLSFVYSVLSEFRLGSGETLVEVLVAVVKQCLHVF